MADQLSQVFAALADPIRRDIVARLALSDATVSALAAPYDVSVQAVSKHLKVLETAGLVRRERDGQRIYSVIEFAPLIRAAVFVSQFELTTEAALDRLDSLLSSGPPHSPEET